MKKEKKIDPSKIDVELRSKSVNAFREKYGMLPPDAGYPVLRQHNRQIFFFKSQDDWREYHSDYEAQNIAKEAMKLLEEQDERIQSLLQSIEDICCGGV